MTDNIDYPIFHRIMDEWITPFRDVIAVNTLGSNKVVDNRFVFGCAAGPSSDLFNLTHEMAHMIEIDSRRAHMPGWGLRYGKEIYIGGRYSRVVYEMSTTKAVEREIRVFGIQLWLNRTYGVIDPLQREGGEDTRDSYFMASLNRWIQNYEMFRGSEDVPYKELDNSAFANIERLILAEYEKWTLLKVHQSWVERMAVLRRKQKRGTFEREQTRYHTPDTLDIWPKA